MRSSAGVVCVRCPGPLASGWVSYARIFVCVRRLYVNVCDASVDVSMMACMRVTAQHYLDVYE